LHLLGVPKHHVLLDVFHHLRDELGRNQLVGAKHRVNRKGQVRLDVSQLVLAGVCERWASQSHCAVLVGGVHLGGFAGVGHQFVDVGHLQLF